MSETANDVMSPGSAGVMPVAVTTDTAQRAANRVERAALVAIYTFAILSGAALIFMVQPMVAKMALPLFGGSPSVWNTSLVFFQAVLLAGYLYAHLSTRLLGLRRQSILHLGVLALPLVALPIRLRLDSVQPDGVPPVLWLLLMLGLTAGLPFFVVSTASPMLQRWFSGLNHPAAADPYFLYAASNAGSLIALLAYPLVIEPNLTLAQQGRVWTGLYLAFAGLCVVAGIMLRLFPAAPATANAVKLDATPLSWRTRLHWIFLAFIPSSLMVGVTNYLSTDVSSAPFLWVIPLAIYLLTFILAFASRQRISIRASSVLLAVAVAVSIAASLRADLIPVAGVIAIHLVLLFAAGMLAHTRLATNRPAADRLTEYFLLISVGGVLGGAFNALVAPVVFDSTLEYPIVLVLALLLRPGRHRSPDGSRLPWALDFVLPLAILIAIVASARLTGSVALVPLVSVLALLLCLKRPVRFAVLAAMLLASTQMDAYSAMLTERTFFGVLRVTEEAGQRHVLSHGTTIHGIQNFGTAESRAEPLSYYTRSGPIGQVFTTLNGDPAFNQVAVVGLGAGSLAAYAEPGQTFTFFEIDPSVVRIASDPQYFTFLADSEAELRMIVGDGRLKLQEEPDGQYDLLVMDAFSSDSVPVHLLTVEAFQSYLDKLQPGGVIAVHISNRNLELEPVVAAIARELDLAGLSQQDFNVTTAEKQAGKTPSHWIALARSPQPLTALAADSRWHPLDTSSTPKAWTDDFSNIISTVKWFK